MFLTARHDSIIITFVTNLVEQQRVRIIVTVAGIVLLLAGAGLAVAAVDSDEEARPVAQAETDAPAEQLEDTPEEGTGTGAGFGSRAPEEATPAGSAVTTGAPALALGPDGEPQPYWRVKQQEARAKAAEEQAAQIAERTSTTETPETVPPRPSATPPTITAAGATSPPTGGSTATTKRPIPPSSGGTRTVGTDGSTPLTGVWAGSAKELSDYLLANNPSPRFTVSALELAGYYVQFAKEVGLRADVLWAQMIHETGYGKYGGDVGPEQNNYAGIGATGGGTQGHAWPNAGDGVKGHIAHMVAYAFSEDKASWTSRAYDPRYDLVSPRGQAKVLSDLDGRWAVPGNGYGERIEKHVRAINQ